MAPEGLVDGIGRCTSLDEFYEAARPLGLHASGPRFLHLELDIVNRCNIRCLMCYHSLEATRRARTVQLSPDDFDRAASRVLPYAYHLSLSLGNEPLMSPHFVSILRIAARYCVPNINFFTNGLLLNDANVDAIISCGVTQVCVSVDGATAGSYNAVRRDGDFHRLIGNVERLVERRNAAGSATPRLRFDVVMMQRNVHELPDLVALGARLGVQQMSFRHVVSFAGLDMERESLARTPALSNYWLERALEAADQFGIEVQTRPAFFNLGDACASRPAPFVPTPYCPFPFFHISMGPGGHVLPCPYSHGQEPYGQVSEEAPLDRIWLNEKFSALRQRILRHDPPEMCRRCSFLADKHPDVADLFVTRKH